MESIERGKDLGKNKSFYYFTLIIHRYIHRVQLVVSGGPNMGSLYNYKLHHATRMNFNQLAELLEKEELPQSAEQARNMAEILRFKIQLEFRSKTRSVRLLPERAERTFEPP